MTSRIREHLRWVVALGLLAWGGLAQAEEELRFPGDEPDHKLVYQFNKGDEATQKAILFSVGAMLRKWGDNVKIVVVAIGPGLHILAKQPKRPVSEETKQRVSSLAQYGVEFHACGNTMKSLHWQDKDMLPFAKIVEVGASDLMELQEQGYAYISW
ncbi:MAG TPA: hypothetical protein ENI97_11165 [Gammaproteobacteria bacterium]|nr:hypothetical protein [Gammaproteobacteria bacterium]